MELTATPCTNPRKIWWFWSESGNMGKTAMTKWLSMNRHCKHIGISKKDAICQIADWVDPEKGHPKPLDVIVMDIPRNASIGLDYTLIEGVCDGFLVNTKYRPRDIMFPAVHMIVFSNEHPDTSALSADRWEIRHVEAPGIE